LKEPHNFCTFN